MHEISIEVMCKDNSFTARSRCILRNIFFRVTIRCILPFKWRDWWNFIDIRFIDTETDLKLSKVCKESDHAFETVKMSNSWLLSEARHRHDRSLNITSTYTDSPLHGTDE